MKLAFVNPPAWNGQGVLREECCWQLSEVAATPTTMLQVATLARQRAEVVFHDATVEGGGFPGIEAFFDRERPAAVVCQLTWPYWPFEAEVVRSCNRRGIDCIVLSNPYGYAEHHAEALEVLFVPTGEPERAVYDWLGGTPVSELKNVAYQSATGEVVKAADGENWFSKLPPLAWDLIPVERYGWLVVNVERDCPYRCQFCSWAKKPQQMKPVETVIADLTELERRGVPMATLMCAQLTTNRKWLKRFCDAKREAGLKIVWETDIHANEVDEEILTWMRDAGCVAVFMGLETVNDELAKGLKQGKKLGAKAKTAIGMCRKVGLHVTVPFLFNIGETDADVDLYLSFLDEARPSAVGAWIIGIYEGSPLADRMRDQEKHYQRIGLVDVPTFPDLEAARARLERFKQGLAKNERWWRTQWYLTNRQALATMVKRKLAMARLRARTAGLLASLSS